MGAPNIVLFSIFVLGFVFSYVSCTEFEAGGENGWIVPQSSNHGDMFNQWASKNRFKVGDTIRFKYKKDSVLVVSEEEYKKCQTTKPEFYSNHHDTVFKLNRSGHCEKGQKMVVKVMEVESPPQYPPPSSSLPASTHKAKKNHAVRKKTRFIGAGLVAVSILVLMVF
ncbi:hypothetical protein EUTSA_v10012234mg [Eutrema salsugineum]|uniref:Phytocyanin domain-containing protein n=1 Tax=Eutrema salsugineum TaxID=72664 RepID=V4JYN1_EUTSA|nr:hypothetical protein EUTSA_v10012234mg [Eutrema salsugineum]